MEHQKAINLLDDTPSQPSKFFTKTWVEINVDSCKTYDINSQIKFKTSVLNSSLWDYKDAYIHVWSNIQNFFSIYWLYKWNKQYTSR